MLVTVTREIFTDKSTGSSISIDGTFECYGLEPPTRAEKPCAIPNGRYKVKLLWSPRFQMLLPHVLGVPGFTGIEWHPGNDPEDTEACTLIGSVREIDRVGNSVSTFTRLLLKLPDEFDVLYIGEPLTILT